MTTVEETILYLPILEDGVATMGDLWDCRESIAVGSLFDSPLTVEDAIASPTQSHKYTLSRIKSAKDILDEMHITVSLKLEALGGAFKFNGSVGFERDGSQKYSEEELRCVYETETYQIRFSNFDKVSQLVRQKIKRGEIIATHFVETIILGGRAEATVCFSQNYNYSHLDLKGELGGTISLGAVTGSARVELEMLDTELSDKFNTNITATAQPRLPVAPIDVASMFEAFDNFDKVVKGECHFQYLQKGSQRIEGVPIKFRLLPIATLFAAEDIPSDHTYLLMDAVLEGAVQDALIILRDFSNKEHVKRLIWEKVSGVQVIFDNAKHPLTQEIAQWGSDLGKVAAKIMREAKSILKDYRFAKVTSADIATFLEKFDEEFAMHEIILKIEDLQNKSREELKSINSHDVVGLSIPVPNATAENQKRLRKNHQSTAIRYRAALQATPTSTRLSKRKILSEFEDDEEKPEVPEVEPDSIPSVHFITSQDELKLWIDKGTSTKFMMQVAQPAEDAPVFNKSKILLQLYEMSKFLHTIGGELGILLPSISDNYSLTIKTSQSSKVYENIADIQLLIEIVTASLQQEMNALKIFFILAGESFGLNFPLQDALDLPNFFEKIKTIRDPMLLLNHSLPEFKATLESDTETISLVLTIMASNSASDQFSLFIELQEILNTNTDYKFSWHFPNLPKNFGENGPLLVGFRGTEPLFACFCALDVAVLKDLLQENSSTFEPLSINEIISGSIYSEQLQYLFKLIASISPTLPLPPLPPVLFPAPQNKSLASASATLSAAATRSYHTVYNITALLALQEVGILLEGLLRGQGIIAGELTRVKFENIDWATLLEELEKLRSMLTGTITSLDLVLKDIKNLDSEMDDDQMETELTVIVSRIRLIVDDGSESERNYLEALLNEVEREIKDEKLHVKRSRFTRALEATLFLLGSAKEFFYINHLVALTKDLAETGTLAESIGAIVLDHIEKTELDEDIYFKEIEELNKALGDGKFYLGLGILTDISESVEHFQINKSLNRISSIGDKNAAKEMLENFGKVGLPKEILQTLFSYPPLVYCIIALKEYPEIISAMTSMFAAPQYKSLENESELIFSKLPQFSSLSLKTVYQMPGVFSSVSEYMGQLKTSIARNEIHDNFLLTLIKSIESDKKFAVELMEKDALPYFEKSSGLFEYPWHLEAIKYSLQRLETIRNDENKVKNLANLKTFPKIKPATSRQIILQPSWSHFTEENQLPFASDEDLFNIVDQYERELQIPDFQANEALLKIFKVIIPSLKFNDTSTFTPAAVATWIGAQQGQNLSRSDALTAFLKAAFESPLLLHVALKNLISQSYAIPLIIQDIEVGMEGKYLSFIESLKSLANSPISANASNILVLRIGDSSPEIGKSSYINSSLFKISAFSSKSEPSGEKGRPISRSGLLELVKINSKILKSKIGNSKNVDINLLNLHGDPLAMNWPLEAIKPSNLSGIVVFWSVRNIAEFTQKKELLLSKYSEEELNISDIILHPEQNFEPTIPSTNILYKEQFEENLEKVTNIFQTMANLCSPAEFCLGPSAMISKPEIKLGSEHAAVFLNIIQTLSIPIIKAESIKNAKESVILNKVADGFLQLIQVEIDPTLLFNSLVHIAYVLDNWSQELSVEVLKKMEKLLQEIAKGPGDLKFEPWNANLLKELGTCRMDYSHTTLKITDIFQVAFQKFKENNLFLEFYTNTLYRGFPVQFLKRNEDGFGLNSLTFNALSTFLKDRRIFVVSIIGYRNSGKSRLIQKLFGPTFQETVSTSGIVLMLHDLSAEQKTKYQLDYILVLDSSGLSINHSIEGSQKYQEIQQTAFLTSISNLVLINVLEDNFKGKIQYLQDVLETSILLASKLIEDGQNPEFMYITQKHKPSKAYLPPLDIPNMCKNIRSFIKREGNQLQITSSKEFLEQLEREVFLDVWNNIVDSSDSDKYEAEIYNLRSKIFVNINDTKGEKRDGDLWLRNVNKSIQLVASSPFELLGQEGISKIENYLKTTQLTKEIKACMDYALLQHVEIIDVYFQNKLIELIDGQIADVEELKKLLAFIERELLETFQLCKGKAGISKEFENENVACGDCHVTQELLENVPNIQQLNDYAMMIRKIEYRRYFRMISEKLVNLEDYNDDGVFKVDSKQSIISPMESILLELSHAYPILKDLLKSKLHLTGQEIPANLENIRVTNLLQFPEPQKINGPQTSLLLEAIHNAVDQVLDLQQTTIGDGIRTYTGVTVKIQEKIDNICSRFEKKFRCKMEPTSLVELISLILSALVQRMSNLSEFPFPSYHFQ